MDAISSQDWSQVDGFPEWLVSNNGDVLHNWTMKIMTTRSNQQGIKMVNLQKEKKIFTRSVALLVAKAYLEPPKNGNYNSVIHLNGDREDCRFQNLMWRPRWYAVKYHQMFEDLPYRLAVHILNTDEHFSSLREACTNYGLIEKNTYLDVINGIPCFHYGWMIEKVDK